MLRNLVLWSSCLALLLTALPASALEVTQMAITTAIVDREPVDSVVVYPIQDTLLYCYTRILHADEPTVVKHAWYRDDQLMSLTELQVKSPDWRTWSAKRLLAGWEGNWRVDVLDADGQLLQSTGFQLR